jgi:hypothetical protein
MPQIQVLLLHRANRVAYQQDWQGWIARRPEPTASAAEGALKMTKSIYDEMSSKSVMILRPLF